MAEIAALAVIDAAARWVPGVVGDDGSVTADSFTRGLLDYPHYTRPASFRGWSVPDVLRSGDHGRIERWRHARMSPDEMAHRLGRHRSTIFRELRRNHFHDSEVPRLSGYWCIVAQSLSDGRRTRQRKLMREPRLRDQVERCLRSGWTPEQIAGRMRHEQAPIRVCHETIYRHIYSEEGRRGELWRHLPSGRRRRRGYRLRKRPPPKSAPELSILFRPDVIAHRKEFGH